MSNHTIGPWKVDEAEGLPLAVIQDNEDGEGIAELGDDFTPENMANARLIAAAPELLEACEKAIEDWEHNLTEAMQMIQAAVKKAKGE